MHKEFVIPGESLAIAEEYSEGENAFLEGEKIYSSSSGKPSYDNLSHEVSVKSRKNPELFKEGDRVLGRVTAVRKARALVKLVTAWQGSELKVLPKTHSTLLVSKVDARYVESLNQEFKIGDLIMAEIDSIKTFGVYIRTDKPFLGVIKAYCTKCKSPLLLKNNKLECTECNRIEKRKTSIDYGKDPLSKTVRCSCCR